MLLNRNIFYINIKHSIISNTWMVLVITLHLESNLDKTTVDAIFYDSSVFQFIGGITGTNFYLLTIKQKQ